LRPIILCAYLVTCTILFPAHAYCQDSIEGSMTAYRVTFDEKGVALFEKTDNIAPGDMIEYRILYENKGGNAFKNLKVDGPIPPYTHYVGNSDSSNVQYTLLVSIDHGNTWEPEPVKRIEQTSDSIQKEVIIPPKKYTHIRWLSEKPLASGETQEFVYRVNLE